MPKQRSETESLHQCALCKWFWMQYPGEIIYAIPNQLIRHDVQAYMMTMEGMVPGMPDLCIPVPRGKYPGMYIEMKKPSLEDVKGGGLSPSQNRVLAYLKEKGYNVIVSYGWTQAMHAIVKYMED